MTLKQILEELWSDPLVRCPWHVTWWNNSQCPSGCERVPHGTQRITDELFYAPGKRVKLEPGGRRAPTNG
jgi:hypothetical protein